MPVWGINWGEKEKACAHLVDRTDEGIHNDDDTSNRVVVDDKTFANDVEDKEMAFLRHSLCLGKSAEACRHR